jgi:phosphomannomutase/phosphoglucomutase
LAEPSRAPCGTASPPARRSTWLVARDGRLSSDRLFAALTSGLVLAGARVTDVGVGPTPLLYFAAHHLDTDGAVMITASHNDAPDNGFKMMRGKASFFGADLQRLAERIEAGTDDRVRAAAGAWKRSTCPRIHRAGEGLSRRHAHRPALRGRRRQRIRRPARHAPPCAPSASRRPALLRHRRPLPQPPPRPHRAREPRRPEGRACARRAPTSASRGTATAIASAPSIANGEIVWGDKLLILFSRALLASTPARRSSAR